MWVDRHTSPCFYYYCQSLLPCRQPSHSILINHQTRVHISHLWLSSPITKPKKLLTCPDVAWLYLCNTTDRTRSDLYTLCSRRQYCVFTILLRLAGDIQTNPGRGVGSVHPCGYWTLRHKYAVCYRNCSVWCHNSSEQLKTQDIVRCSMASLQCGHLRF